jgi:ABC-type branched-subunit amino acid transport system ATPase component/ABC-type branched-subunit amino acid transport system permease subunit
MQLVNLGLISLIVVVGLNFITGYCGQINFAQAAFWGIGAYVTALLTLNGLSFWFALPLAAVATGLCSLLLGVPTLRLRAFYLAMATIAFGEIVQLVLVHWESVTGGTSGLRNVPGITLFGHTLTGHREHYYFLLAWAALGLGLSLRIRASQIGRAMIALRDSEIAAEVMGVDTVRTKMLAFTLSSVYAGVAGSLYVSSLHYVSPDLFSNAQAVLFFVMLVIGGAGSAVGAVVGTAVLTVLPEALRFLKEWYLVLYGTGIILMVCFLPEGLISLRQRWTGWRRSGPAAAESASPDAGLDAGPTQPADGSFLTARFRPAAGSTRTDGGLAVQAVTQRFGGLVALDAVSLRVAPGTVHAVIGPNGSGKTTFLNVLSGAYVAQSGSVQLAGTELIGRRPSAIARAGLSRTFQNIRVYKSLSVLENVMVGAACHQPAGWRGLLGILAGTAAHRRQEQSLHASALQALNFVGLAALAQRPAGSLAYAQQRLLEIARALATQPRVLLLDEPAAGMNPQESTRLMAVIAAIRSAGITVVFVEHNVRLVMGVSDMVTVFDFGKKIAEGTPQQVQADEAVIAAYLGRPRNRPAADPANPAGSTPELDHA